jgi:hypothetical protein
VLIGYIDKLTLRGLPPTPRIVRNFAEEIVMGPVGMRPAGRLYMWSALPAAYPTVRSPDPDVDAGPPGYRHYTILASVQQNISMIKGICILLRG